VARPGQCILIKPGSDIVLQLHYTTNGKAGDDKSEVVLFFAKEKPTARLVMLSHDFQVRHSAQRIPTMKSRRRSTLQRDSTLMMFFPHMHLRGKDMDMPSRRLLPDGQRQDKAAKRAPSLKLALVYCLQPAPFFCRAARNVAIMSISLPRRCMWRKNIIKVESLWSVTFAATS